MCLMASQCAGPGFAAKRVTVATANAMSGQVASATQLRAPMASQYGTSCMIACYALALVSTMLRYSLFVFLSFPQYTSVQVTLHFPYMLPYANMALTLKCYQTRSRSSHSFT